MEWLEILSQWLHLMSAVTLIGGLLYVRLVLVPSLVDAPLESRSKLLERLVARWRPLAFTAMGALVLTGLFNFLTHLHGHSRAYHMAFGIKLLLVLHVFSVVMLLAVPPGVNPARDARRPRLMLGAVISGLIILLLSAFLRRTF